MRITFKAKHIGARYIGSESVQYIGESRIDGYPMFSYETEDKEVDLSYVWNRFVFNGRPGCIPEPTDFDIIAPIDEPFAPRIGMVERYSGKSTITVGDIIQVQPMELPTRGLYYFDYVYEMEIDNSLLLML